MGFALAMVLAVFFVAPEVNGLLVVARRESNSRGIEAAQYSGSLHSLLSAGVAKTATLLPRPITFHRKLGNLRGVRDVKERMKLDATCQQRLGGVKLPKRQFDV